MVLGFGFAHRRSFARRGLTGSAAVFGALVIAAPSAFANSDSIRFDFDPTDPNATHEWTVPTGVTEVEVEAAGAGGGGVDDPDVSGGDGALVKATVTTQGGDTFSVGLGGGGDEFVLPSGKSVGGAGGGGASVVTSSSAGLSDLLIIAGGGGGAGRGGDTARSGDGGNAGANTTNGDGASAPAVSFLDGGVGGGSGTGRDYFGQDFVAGSTSSTNGAGGARTQFDGTRAAAVGGQGGEVSTRGGTGGAGYGGGGMGNTGTVNSVSAARGGGAGGSTAQGTAVSLVEGETSHYSSAGGAGGVAGGGEHGWVVITWVVPPPLPDPDEPAGAASVQREPVVLTLTMPAGLACSAPTSDASGTWIQLPAANECNDDTSNTGRSGEAAGLLGWATTPDFPTDIAQRQVDNGWGAYEMFDESGSLSAVFIPAGGWTQASSDTSLFPIWS